MSSLEAGARTRVATQGMAYGPHAVGRVDGLVLFVRGAAPDEEVEVVVRERRRSHAFAEVVAVTRPSARRVATPCVYLPRCGGCSWQHLDYAAQLEAKREIVADQLRRFAAIDVPVRPLLASPRVYGYRGRIKLRVENRRVGFYAGASHDLVPVRHCLLAESAIDAAIPAAAELAQRLTSRLRRIEIIARRSGERGVVFAGEVEGAWRAADRDVCEDWLRAAPERRALVLRGRGWAQAWGDATVSTAVEPGVDLELTAPGFTQVNPLANRILVETVIDFVAARPGHSILDLYSGAGNFAAALARRGADVLAVEHGETAAAAAVNARRSPGGWQVARQRVERKLASLAASGERFDAAVLDPPRSGAAAAVPWLLRLAPQRIVYVSCDPATLARDLKALRVRYEVRAVQPLDLFPHTYHVETVVLCELSC